MRRAARAPHSKDRHPHLRKSRFPPIAQQLSYSSPVPSTPRRWRIRSLRLQMASSCASRLPSPIPPKTSTTAPIAARTPSRRTEARVPLWQAPSRILRNGARSISDTPSGGYLGYPIWWGKAPRVILTFLEGADTTGKRIIPFCTSGSSPVSGSIDELHAAAPEAEWGEGRRFASNAPRQEIDTWMEEVR